MDIPKTFFCFGCSEIERERKEEQWGEKKTEKEIILSHEW
jgi:hypothetical protein